MHKLLWVLPPLLGAATVLAQAAEPDFDLRRKACPAVAQQAGFAYTVKHENKQAYELTKDLASGMLSPIFQWSIDYAQNQATGIDDAVHRATEKCLRNVEMVQRNARDGKATRVEDLQ